MSDLTSAGTAVGGAPVGGDGPSTEATTGGEGRSASLWADARRQLLRDPIFVIAFIYVLVVGSMAAFPKLWTSQDPRSCNTDRSRISPSGEHPFGFDILGCDYYAHAIYGARPSMVIAVMATSGIVLFGGTLGLLAGYYGGWVDTIISRVMDIFFSLPFLLGAIVFLTVIKRQNIWTITGVLFLLAWPTIARIIRGSVISSKDLDYVQAAKAVGARNSRLMFRHILPNAIAPMLVYATIVLGSFVAAEATLTFLGVGLQPPAQSWGIMISTHQVYFLEDPWLLLFPCGLLVGTVLSFILMGDALRDALDPKFR
ncbi:peptide/nickel transport system permease protein/oligopeptide transport system permease protein [Micromonospora phaseoli]|uniref:Peptide/nickel transport system permease protein/oligopeptide transport system permease protein n=1 Tax=Micromonospora phaseoli TaxID=1144548 RepID=A0A1H6WX37_9ACTN|nr:ABC transporter permease [Micromonospora phaseoli]PZW01987.1 peptide/nickel transport system permease protein/oligopeptide transport system permease protein [Micromonospora phaseoli]GIJ81161.1 peptide ABC transporter permease [Micromonospora phaseoli]SEJ21433.1 peptide/nickel transport system permease protein/oligopeptide transport system permease protein [Micromonospora phaseoli]